MKKHVSLELRVSVDVGCRSHNVAIGLSSGEILDEFSIAHEPKGFRHFFSRIEKQERIKWGQVLKYKKERIKWGQVLKYKK